MAKIDSDILIKSESVIPLEIIHQSKDLFDVLLANIPFMVTIFIVVCGSVVTYRSNRKSVESQNVLAIEARNSEHENNIAEFRHKWLQEVRSTGSELCKTIHEVQGVTSRRNYFIKLSNSTEDKGKKMAYTRQAASMLDDLYLKQAEYYKLSTQLKLFFKKDDLSTVKLFKLLSKVKERMNDFDRTTLDDKTIELITEELQIILKSEWEITKSRTWTKNT